MTTAQPQPDQSAKIMSGVALAKRVRDEAAAEAAARAVDDFILGMGMPHRIRELEIPESDLPEIAELVLTDGGCRSNPIPITSVEQVLEVLKAAF